MKQITKMSRLSSMLEKLFRELNNDIFDGQLEMPVITVTPTKRAYAHYTPFNAWSVGEQRKHEINIASGTLDRPLENIVASLLHEMVHYYNDTILNVQDVSRGNSYHNKQFAKSCALHGLICSKTDKYGWSKTELNDDMIEWLLLHNEFREIEMNRDYFATSGMSIGTKAADSNNGLTVTTTSKTTSSRRYVCPCCNMIIRATRKVNVICGNCMEHLIET